MNAPTPNPLLGIGLYTAAESARLTGISGRKIIRWLRGHDIGAKHYDPLWTPQVSIPEEGLYLGFRDLMELRAAAAIIGEGVSPVAVRKAIDEARRLDIGSHPLSSRAFRTDGKAIFLEIANETGDVVLLDLLKRQFAFQEILKQSLRDTEFDADVPVRWWPRRRQAGILVDPTRSFGQPIEADSGIPTAVLAAAAEAEGGAEQAARLWLVPVAAIRRAIEFETRLASRAA
ncbi:hypothetical protein [Aurantimonas sp. Leaf443]|uniref:hypothetical protein n=1 Tax=Aurantimonas sp. Leaf443 TaxID=1736378 RepID=UPI000701D61C|nr:hypothetical protein [Aurantimonas sp. Leaf443]KQT86060.1 hypothetical protein ASG48_05610 [Aurantimonas sp. Leaf443]